MTDLKPCPFCGGEAELHPTYDMTTGAVDGWFAWCDNDTCECKPETGQFFTEAEAVVAWNARAERTCRMEYQTEGMQRGWWKCSECGEAMDTIEACGGRKPPRWCGNCGARVVE